MEVKKMAKEWEIWDEEEKGAKSEDHVIEVKEGFVLRKEKVYSLLRKERGKVYEFIEEQLRKGYIRL